MGCCLDGGLPATVASSSSAPGACTPSSFHMFEPTSCPTPKRACCTLQGAFAELWEAQGIAAGDTLVFRRDPHSRTIELSRMPAGSAHAAHIKPEEVGAGCCAQCSLSLLCSACPGNGMLSVSHKAVPSLDAMLLLSVPVAASPSLDCHPPCCPSPLPACLLQHGAGSEQSDPSTAVEGSGGGRSQRGHLRQEACSDQTRGAEPAGLAPQPLDGAG